MNLLKPTKVSTFFENILATSNREFPTLLVLSVAIIISSLYGANRGLNWSDYGQIFHFGNRILNGDFPYRDFSYQTGFIAIFVNAFFQKLLGQYYFSSLVVGLLVKLFTLLALYFTLRQFTSRFISINICIGFSLLAPELISSGHEYWVNLFLTIAGLFIVIGCKNLESQNAYLYILLAGIYLGLTVGLRQSNGILCILVTSVVILCHSLKYGKAYIQKVTLPLIAGVCVSLVAIASFLLLNKAMSAAIYELFIAAGEKKNFSAFSGALDALSGGAFFGSSVTNAIIKNILYNVIPLLIIGGIFILIKSASNSPKQQAFNHKIGVLIPVLAILGIAIQEIARFGSTGNHSIGQIISEIFIYDIPRISLSIALLMGCLWPTKTEAFLGLSAPIFSILVAFTLGTVWSMQMSWVGRSYVSTRMLIALVMLVAIASNQIPNAWKKRLSTAFLLVAIGVFYSQVISHSLGQEGIYVGFYKNNYSLNHPMTKFITVHQEKAKAFSMLRQYIKPGDSCFIYGSAPILYTLLDCKNPTRNDVAYADAVTLNDARKAVAALKANPPEWIIETPLAPAIEKESKNPPSFYDFAGQPGPIELRAGLKDMIKNYRLVSQVKELFPEAEKLETRDFDQVLKYRLYKLEP
ncbi:hypothetical protein [Microseira wollei]|uniref:Glycosyltransferase RgtA/B/C/D-like domain-containing protein n=1 Tax=Microseira wollei NIES-4236 TaxID=2530354 RepID=A0AAV3X6D1_9CYAN|nr:hypothetical protein [Microseira wollei]GET35767.1 hypothetical protein MiSe_05130 [Microseira wollei NIES-4236]